MTDFPFGGRFSDTSVQISTIFLMGLYIQPSGCLLYILEEPALSR